MSSRAFRPLSPHGGSSDQPHDSWLVSFVDLHDRCPSDQSSTINVPYVLYTPQCYSTCQHDRNSSQVGIPEQRPWTASFVRIGWLVRAPNRWVGSIGECTIAYRAPQALCQPRISLKLRPIPELSSSCLVMETPKLIWWSDSRKWYCL